MHRARAPFEGRASGSREDIEPAGAKSELDSLRVDHHIVAESDSAGQLRIGDTVTAVDLEPDEARMPLNDCGHCPRRRLSGIVRAASTSESVTSTIDSRSATEISSSGLWMCAIPFESTAQGTHDR